MIKGLVRKVKIQDLKPFYDVEISEQRGLLVYTLERKSFHTNMPKSKMLDWATEHGAEEVTFKL